MRSRSPLPISALLGTAVKRAGIEREVTLAQIIEAANDAVAALLPPGRQADARAQSLRDGVLTVLCRHASAAQLVTRQAAAIVDAVKRAAPKADIRRVLVRVAPGAAKPSGMIE